MINTLTRAATLGALMIAAIFASHAPAFSQAPTQAQRDAIKSQCRSDYMAHCSSVPPGGEASLQCLQKNMSSLASGCQGAVRAVEAPAAAPKAESAPAASKTESAPPAAAAKPPPRPRRRKPRPARRRNSRAARRSLPFAAPAAPTIPRSAQACRPAARRRCNAWKRTRQSFRPLASRRSRPPAAAVQRAARLRRLPLQRLPRQRRLRPSSSWCGRCGRPKNCTYCGRPAAPMSVRFAAAWHLAVGASCSASQPTLPRFRPRARMC